MAATSTFKITNEFADETRNTISIGPIDTTKLNPNLKADVIGFNNSMTQNGYGSYLQSKAGANWVGISRLQMVTIDRNYIF